MRATSQPQTPGSLVHRKPFRFETTFIERVFAALEAATGNSHCIEIVLRFDGRIDERLLARAVRCTLDIEPYLRCRFVEGWLQPYWQAHGTMEEFQFFEICETDNWRETLQNILARRIDSEGDCSIKVFLLRDTIDIVCVKLDHKMGDGRVLKQYAYLLAETYSRLARDPQYAPPANPYRNRSLAQITQGISAQERRSLLRNSQSQPPRPGEVADWHLPGPPQSATGLPASCFLVKQIPAERQAAISLYATHLQATRNSVLLASFAKAAMNTIPRSSGKWTEIMQTVDLRRYLPGREAGAPCNLSGLLRLRVDQSANDPLDHFVRGMNDQMDAARKGFMGLSHRLIRWEINRKRRFLFNCIPFRMIKRTARRRVRRLQLRGSPSCLVFSNVGEISTDLLTFSGARVEDVFVTASPLMERETLLACVAEFRGSLSLCIGYSPHFVDGDIITMLLENMADNLPK